VGRGGEVGVGGGVLVGVGVTEGVKVGMWVGQRVVVGGKVTVACGVKLARAERVGVATGRVSVALGSGSIFRSRPEPLLSALRIAWRASAVRPQAVRKKASTPLSSKRINQLSWNIPAAERINDDLLILSNMRIL
jgi:hypothetical protein